MKDVYQGSPNIKAITLEEFPHVKSTGEFLSETVARIKASNQSGNILISIDDLPASGRILTNDSYLKKKSLYSIFLALLSADYPTIKSRLQDLMSVSKYLWVSVKGAGISQAMAQDIGFMLVTS